MRTVAAVVATLVTAASSASAEGRPRPGLYRVQVSLEIPNVQGAVPFRTVERCVRPGQGDGGLVAIVSNPEIASCPVAHRSRAEDRLELDLACEPANTGRASARYELAPTGYTARIAVTMGGKNMTLTEVQRAERAGECP
jgi:Protein of unknown function (DUF3617)